MVTTSLHVQVILNVLACWHKFVIFPQVRLLDIVCVLKAMHGMEHNVVFI